MKLTECKIIEGHAFNILENKNSPLRVLHENFHSLEALVIAATGGAERICFIGGSCMYPMRESALREEMLGTGEVYEGNALYSYIKLLGWQICKMASQEFKTQAFLVIPSDIFGDPDDSHFITQIMKKMHVAKVNAWPNVSIWGSGRPVRHPLFKADYEKILKEICETYTGTEAVNIAPPVSYAKSISSIALDIQEVVGYTGTLVFDASFPDGQPVKILDNSRLTALGFSDFTPWKNALENTYNEIKNHL